MYLSIPKRLLLFTAASAALSAAPANNTPMVTLPAGTSVPVRLAQSIDTKRDKPGTRFVAHVSDSVMRDGQVILQRNAACHGHLVQSKPSGRLTGRAKITLSLDSCESYGEIYTIATAEPTFVSKDHKKRNAALIGGGAGTGAGIGAIAGGGVGALIGAGAGAVAGTTGAVITGKRNLHLAAETRLNFSLRRPLTVRVPVQAAQNRAGRRG